MKILKFSATGLHGFLDQHVDFHNELTFLTGINGTGKSSVIHSIIALIGPSPEILANLEFFTMQVTVSHDHSDITIKARKSESEVIITIDGSAEEFRFMPYQYDEDPYSFASGDEDSEYYRNLLVQNSSNPVLAAIAKFPTPMFLDLDRKSAIARTLRRRTLRRRRTRNIFSVSLAASLTTAAALAENEQIKVEAQLRKISNKYRRDLILNLLHYEPQNIFGGLQLQIPMSKDLEAIAKLNRASQSIPHILQMKPGDIETNLKIFLDKMDGWARSIPKNKKAEEILQGSKLKGDAQFEALVSWSSNLPQLRKISEMLQIVEGYNAAIAAETKTTKRYLDSINKFFRDSHKNLKFDETQNLVFNVGTSAKSRDISSLSSGEAQILVILTHLFFDPAAQLANVFIIDEPELSLHVAWQEIFVDSLIEANPSIQYIMATHSPSIIMDRIDDCRDLGKSVRIRPEA